MDPRETPNGARYGMVIDLDTCSGCGACAVACAVENNVPPAQERANERNGITWLRVHRLEVPGEARAAVLPLMGQQCGDKTPCASVCPQNAVEVDPTSGIVAQIPVRCLGCRYCMAACPYHARSFNWWDPDWPGRLTETLNPEVSTRTRGVVPPPFAACASWAACSRWLQNVHFSTTPRVRVETSGLSVFSMPAGQIGSHQLK